MNKINSLCVQKSNKKQNSYEKIIWNFTFIFV